MEKHVANKHPELVKGLDEVCESSLRELGVSDQLLQIPYFNNFALDPHHITPFSHPPQNSGSSQQPPPQAYGLPGPAPFPPPPDYARGAPFYPPYQYAPQPPFPNGGGPGYWDPYAYQYAQPPYAPGRDGPGKRLSDRISGFAPGFDQPSELVAAPASAGLPAKPMVSGLDSALPDDTRGRKGGPRKNGGRADGVPPPPPPDAKEDPRAAAGKKVSYHDMDLVAEGEVELQY